MRVSLVIAAINEKRKKVLSRGIILLLLICLSLAWYGIYFEPYQVEVRHLWFEDSQLEIPLEGRTVVHLSDLHIRRIGKRERKVLDILDELQPDLVFLTGDYVPWTGDYEAALAFLSKLKAKVGVWAVMGDYDYSNSRRSCLFCHEQGRVDSNQRHQVRFLRNTIERVSLENRFIYIGGIDREGQEHFSDQQRFLDWKGKEPAIIMSHNPLDFNLLDDNLDALMLSGDTHGGQLPLPSWLWGLLGYEKNARYNKGLFVKGRKKMFVNSGIGTSHFPIRVLRRPEVVVLHFGNKGPTVL